MDSPLSSDLDSEQREDEELAIEAKRALAYLQTKRNYRYVEFLAQGGYGWVALVYDDTKNRALAIKCTTDTSEMELSWWIRLQHPNILLLLEYITLDTCTVFIMPAMRKDLWMVVNEPRFYDEELSFGLCRIWLRDVAAALTYLHGQFLCHLDLKLDNVFLKEDGFVCLGDFSLLTDIREVPSGFHFLETYEPPEYTQWCHGAPPEAIASAMKFGGDKADMWQFGILAIDLLSNLKLSGSKSGFTMFHHDVWPLLQKILLHEEYLNYLLEETFLNVLFKEEDLRLCHAFLTSILNIEPDARMSAVDAKKHAFVNIEWPQLPKEFSLPEVVVEHLPEPLPLPIEELKDTSLTVEEVMATAQEKASEEAMEEGPDCLDVMKRKMNKLKKEKKVRRQSIFAEAGKKPLEIKAAPSGLLRKATPLPKEQTLPEGEEDILDVADEVEETKEEKTAIEETKEEKTAIEETKKEKTAIEKDPTKDPSVSEVIVTNPVVRTPSGGNRSIKVTVIKKKTDGSKKRKEKRKKI